MNILFIVTWYSEHGVPIDSGLFHYETAKALQKYCNVAIYWPCDSSLSCSEFTRYNENGIITYRRGSGKLAYSFTKKIINKIRSIENYKNYQKDLENIVREFRPDVIHAQCGIIAGLIAGLYNRAASKTIGGISIPYIVTEHHPIELMRLTSKISRLKFNFAYKHASANFCVSDDLMKKLDFYFPKQRFKVIYNGINDPSVFLNSAQSTMSKACDNSIYHLGFVNAAIVAAFYDKDIKGFQYLLPAIKGLKDHGIKIYLHVLGGGTYLDYYKTMATELDINNCITFYGQCDKETVYKYVSQIDFGISASLFESAGVTIEEMQLLGKPVVVTKSGGANSLVRDFSAIVVENGSIDALVEGLSAMVLKYKEFDSAKIRQYATENFEMDNICKKYLEIYRKISEIRSIKK
jgi:glycosyltransferase involved in cell wall biosynthesis